MKADGFRDRWKGKTVVCIASGPSLVEKDCELVRSSGLITIVTNNTFKMCPWAHVLFAFDGKWWHTYRKEVEMVFGGLKATNWQSGESYGAISLFGKHWFINFGNSGTNAISLAMAGGAKKIVLLGYDAQRTDGKAHWHGDHIESLSNCRSISRWPAQFKHVQVFARRKGIEIINCSRETALDCFPRKDLCEVLESEVAEA